MDNSVALLLLVSNGLLVGLLAGTVLCAYVTHLATRYSTVKGLFLGFLSVFLVALAGLAWTPIGFYWGTSGYAVLSYPEMNWFPAVGHSGLAVLHSQNPGMGDLLFLCGGLMGLEVSRVLYFLVLFSFVDEKRRETPGRGD